MDLIAPDGAGDPYTEPNSYILNYTTRKLTYAAPFTYGPYGGTSPACANVSGSASLLLSHYFKIDSLVDIEPEDIQNILKASAWRGDTQRLAHSDLSHSWVPDNGYGHLDIGHAFEMLDTNVSAYPDAGYKLYHAAAVSVPMLDTGTWSSFSTAFNFSPAWQYDSGVAGITDSFATIYMPLPENSLHLYKARWRTLTFTYPLPDSLENSDTCPLFAWGRSGGAGNPSGWSFASDPNYETGWTKVMNGLGSDPDSLMDGIFAPSDGVIQLETVQYDVYGWVDSTGSYSHYYGHCPPDPQVAVNFSYLGRAKQPASLVQEPQNLSSDSLIVSVNAQGTSIDAKFFSLADLPNVRIEFRDILGRLIYSTELPNANFGWNETKIPSANIASGAYFCVVTSDNYFQTKDFLLLK